MYNNQQPQPSDYIKETTAERLLCYMEMLCKWEENTYEMIRLYENFCDYNSELYKKYYNMWIGLLNPNPFIYSWSF